MFNNFLKIIFNFRYFFFNFFIYKFDICTKKLYFYYYYILNIIYFINNANLIVYLYILLNFNFYFVICIIIFLCYIITLWQEAFIFMYMTEEQEKAWRNYYLERYGIDVANMPTTDFLNKNRVYELDMNWFNLEVYDWESVDVPGNPSKDGDNIFAVLKSFIKKFWLKVKMLDAYFFGFTVFGLLGIIVYILWKIWNP